ncbi:right-handed parallel beta-helix repeat-containing protein [Pedobacter sp. MC2016-14]|uniref:right-handed parallel beta-helix repeat-containing protein n=1 Tax=Pedobacter sp. MC2016-14 TaxID=2897327 RepID=UPI001E4D63E5|nr:right-handed parallel beta-helix repeat-containing protein [Pedobacter sp. MC2016-14]MCD0490344.1 right-handed parallel beta-helix repeat-containing protein [Pedobacter sp. MC2016-14]
MKLKYTNAILFSFLFLLLVSPSFALSIYVSPFGNDSNPGTKEKPMASLLAARDRIRTLRMQIKNKTEHIEIIIAAGEYFLNEPLRLYPEDGGTSMASVTYKAETGAKPVFYGGVKINGFEKVNDQLWRVYIPEVKRFGFDFEQFYVNNSRATRAQYPNTGFYHPKSVTESVLEKGEDRNGSFAIQKITLNPEQKALFDQLPASDLENAVLVFYHKWDNTRKKLIRYSSKDSTFYVMGSVMKHWNKLDAKTLFTVENVKAGLDTPGEWYLEKSNGYLYYVPKPGESIANTSGFAPILDNFLIIEGNENQKVENLRFENLSFQVAGYKMPALGNEPMQGAALIEATIMVDFATKVEFLNCEIAHTGSNAVWFRKACAYGKVEHSYLHDLGAGGVKIGELRASGIENTHHIIVHNNIVRHGGYVFPCAVGLMIFTGSDCELTHNEIADLKYSAISAGWVWGYKESPAKRNKIEFNHIHHLGWGVLSDMGGVYTLSPSEGTTVSNNVIHHVYSATYGGWGLYTDEGSTGIVMENNLVYACKSSAFHQHYGKDNVIRNNIFYNQIRSQLEASKVEPHIGFRFTNNIIYYNQGNLAGIRWDKCNFLSDYNAYWDTRTKDIKVGTQTFKEWQKSGKDVHSVISDPKFADPARLDFSIKNRSLLSKISFKPFDYSKAGVYGDVSWKELAKFDAKLAKQFDDLVQDYESIKIDHNAGL